MIFSKKNFFEAGIFFLVAGFISYFLFKDSISLFPSFVHAWTQSDRYALSLGFLNNGFDFFHPQTFNLVSSNGITQVDFPVHEYAVAILMKLSGVHEPIVFRIYTLLYGLTGLFFLLKLTKLAGGSFFHGLFVAVFIMTCPVFAYYLDGFLPSIPSFSNLIIGYYFFFRYKKTVARRDIVIAIIFFTIAALARLPFVIFLFAAFCQQGLGYFRSKKINKSEIFLFLSGFFLVVLYFFYNIHLSHKYGTQFLTYLMPAKNFTELKELVVEVIIQWKLDYFLNAHYFILLTIVISVLISVSRKRFHHDNNIIIQTVIIFFGAVTFFLLMTQQFPDHDYYFIDSFYPVVALFLVYTVPKFRPNSSFVYRFVLVSVTCVLFFFFVTGVGKTLNERYTFHEWDRTEITRQNFTGAEHFLDSIGIPKTAKMLVLDAYTTNTPLILMNRSGYTLLRTSKERIDTTLKKDFDYAVMQNCFLVSDVINFIPAITKQLEKVADNGFISIYLKREKADRSLEDFLGINKEQILYTCYNDFENDTGCKGSNLPVRSKEKIFSGSFSSPVHPEEEFTPGFQFTKKEAPFSRSTKILIRTMVLRENIDKDIDVVAALKHGDETYFYRNFSLNRYLEKSGGWHELMLQFVLPEIKSEEDKLSVYFWNKEKNKFYLDNFSLVMYP